MKHSFKEWLIATRPWSFPVSTMSVAVSTALLYYMGFEINWYLAVGALLTIILFHAAGNLISDWYDFKKGIDAEDTISVPTLTKGLFQPKEILIYGLTLLFLGSLAGLLLCWFSSWELLIYGGLGFVLTLAYPWMKSHAMGDLDILLCYGLVPALGTSVAVTGIMHPEVLWGVPAFATITIAVLHTNNTRDVRTDSRAGIKTFAMLLGKETSIALYIVEVCLPCLWVIAAVCCGRLPWLTLLILTTIIPINKNCQQAVLFEKDDHAMDMLDQATAQHQLMNSILLVVGLVVAKVLGL